MAMDGQGVDVKLAGATSYRCLGDGATFQPPPEGHPVSV